MRFRLSVAALHYPATSVHTRCIVTGPKRKNAFFDGQRGTVQSCSNEHDCEIPLIFAAAGAAPPSSTATRTQSMAETSNTLRQILERIRDDTQQALKLLGDSEESRSLRWKCDTCGHVKYFTRPVPAEVAPPCPKCRASLSNRYDKRAALTPFLTKSGPRAELKFSSGVLRAHRRASLTICATLSSLTPRCLQ